ncbi:3-phosphoshikimate 1-carboxyvinyltransferase [uncultured Bifidobacterium sp.]|uniref:3-phosphoshikimate 1-carboxyvinyltransferase n=1 Tax=uncultured Bifidobacterium sp. TaxID=165187 RepID=UPI00260C3489|nr:3-phosphoshikimate 1-carboxyvinyltransferase [uncultured Bifidobacterium sp.]
MPNVESNPSASRPSAASTSASALPASDVKPGELWNAPVSTGPLDATVEIPGSKSLSNRYLVLAALGSSPIELDGLLRSRDTDLMMDALTALGVRCRVIDGLDTRVMVTPPVGGRFTGGCRIDCGLAGTVMRFVPALTLFADGPVYFDGDDQAKSRPMRPILDGLEQLGARIDYHGDPGFLPFTVTPPTTLPLGRADVTIDSSRSSQFISGLLLVGPRLPQGMSLTHDGGPLPSMPHIRMTMQDVTAAGGGVTMPTPEQWIVEHADLRLPDTVVVEPDLSNAAPFLGAALIAGGRVRVPRWPVTTTQPGGLLPGILIRMGATATLDGRPWSDGDNRGSDRAAGLIEVAGPTDGIIHGLGRFDLSAAGELAPSVAALAAVADSGTDLVGIAHLRGHETNRLAALVEQLRAVGCDAVELDDGVSIRPAPRETLRGTVMRTYRDHRMATFAAMLGLAIPGTRIKDVATTRKTLPDFPRMWTGMLKGTSVGENR